MVGLLIKKRRGDKKSSESESIFRGEGWWNHNFHLKIKKTSIINFNPIKRVGERFHSAIKNDQRVRSEVGRVL